MITDLPSLVKFLMIFIKSSISFKEISFSDLNGQSVLLLTRIGFWNKVCQRMIPESHLLFQDDPSVFNELTKMSALPNFRSNITIQREEAEDNRILIPITDPEAHVRYYAIYPKDKRNLFQPIIKQIKNIDWKKKDNCLTNLKFHKH